MKTVEFQQIVVPEATQTAALALSNFLGNVLLLLIFVSLTFRFQLRLPGQGYYATLANLLILILFASFFLYILIFKIHRTKTRLDLPYVLFALSIILGWGLGIIYHGLNIDIFYDIRFFIQFFLFFIVTFMRFNYASLTNFFYKLCILIILSVVMASCYSLVAAIFNLEHPLDIANPWDFHDYMVGEIKRSAALVPTSIFLIAPVLLLSLFMLGKLNKWQFCGLFFLCFLGIIFTMTRSIWLGSLLSLFTFLLLNIKLIRKSILHLFLAILIILTILFLTTQYIFNIDIIDLIKHRFDIFVFLYSHDIGSIDHRLEESLSYIELFQKYPFFGAGLGSSIDFYSIALKEFVARINWHNAYAMLLGKLGLFGFLSFAFILFSLVKELIHVINHDRNKSAIIFVKCFLSALTATIITNFSISTLISFDFTILFVTLSALVGIYGHYLRKHAYIVRIQYGE